ncbi:polyadenylate-binding protein-interacting protein 4-like protein [Tanacetum coccineum]
MGYERRSSKTDMNDALLLTTMCLIGLSVDVHIKDGSVYSGIFHTASVNHPYAIVLKRARMTKKGKYSSNVANEEVIATLIIQSEDLVQVVAKREMLPADGVAGHETGDVTGAVASTFPSNGNPLKETNKMTSESNVGQSHANKTKGSSGTENGFANKLKPDITVQSTTALQVNKNADTVPSAPSATISSSTPCEAVTTKVSTSNRAPKVVLEDWDQVLLCMISSQFLKDMVPGTNGFPQMSTCSILTPHQVHHIPKHQGNATAQALQLCAPPSFIGGGGQPPFVMPTHIPISQPPYPMIRPISVPGSNGFFVSKFS